MRYCNYQARSENGPVLRQRRPASEKKGEKNLSISHGNHAPALLQCCEALFLVQAGGEEAGHPIKNLSGLAKFCVTGQATAQNCRIIRH
ncbi:hypothetical protein ACLHDD_03145 [Pantoea sp. NSTU24]|uniref:hypothetical protein n=1 Tax=Pantoea sp. NSTU24 TaxID=3391144 RepID=UPI003D06C6B9